MDVRGGQWIKLNRLNRQNADFAVKSATVPAAGHISSLLSGSSGRVYEHHYGLKSCGVPFGTHQMLGFKSLTLSVFKWLCSHSVLSHLPLTALLPHLPHILCHAVFMGAWNRSTAHGHLACCYVDYHHWYVFLVFSAFSWNVSISMPLKAMYSLELKKENSLSLHMPITLLLERNYHKV